MKVLIKDLAHYHKLNPDQLVAFAHEYRNLYGVFDDDTDNPLDTAKTSTWHSNELVKDFKHANRKGHDWRDDLPQNKNRNMKKMVKESLNETEFYAGYGKEDPYDSKKEIPLNQHAYKMLRVKVNQLETAKKACEEIIKDAEETLEVPAKPYDDSSHIDAQARKEVAEQILSILK